MKKIIVPIDFSSKASNALDFAIEFNEKVKGKIILLNIIEMGVSQVSISGEAVISNPELVYTAEFIKATKRRLDEWSQRVSAAGQEVFSHMMFGNPFIKISKMIAKEEADWIIMGSMGASGLKEIFIGSNAERMIRYAKCPVIIIKGETHLKDIKSMTFTSDLSEEQDIIVHHAKDIQEMFKLNMHVVKVKTPYNWLDEKQVTRQLDHFAKRNNLMDYTLNSVEADFVDDGVIKFSEEAKTGLIVMGTHGRRGIARFIGGSVAEDIVNESNIPIIVYKIWDS